MFFFRQVTKLNVQYDPIFMKINVHLHKWAYIKLPRMIYQPITAVTMDSEIKVIVSSCGLLVISNFSTSIYWFNLVIVIF